MIEDHRVTFLGDKVAHGFGGKVGSFLMGRDVAAAGIAVAFAAVAAELVMPGGSTAMKAAAYTLEANALGIGVAKLCEHMIMGCFLPKGSAKEKVINTQPDPYLPSNLDQWGVPAYTMKYIYGTWVGLAAAITALNVHSFAGPDGFLLAMDGFQTASILTRFVSGFHRWNNVWNGKWRVEDRGPPPKPVRKVKGLNPVAVSAAARVAHAPV